LLVHNLPERGSYFRALEIGKRLAARGHHVELGHISEWKKYRPEFAPVTMEDVPSADFSRIGFPYKTFLNERQEGWGMFDNGWRMARAIRHKWDLVYGFSHKPDCVLPGLVAQLRGARFVLDWSDWWGGAEGLYRACVLPSDYFQSLPLPLRALRRSVFAAEEWWEPHVYRLADAATLISHEYLHHPRACPDLRAKSHVMHSGAPLEQIKPVPVDEARKACGLEYPAGAIVLGYVANFHTDEELLMNAFADVCAKAGNVHLLVVGSDFEKGTPATHQRVKDRIRHLGRKPFGEIGKYLCAADILLLPLSDVLLNRARYPHKLSDYVASGRPIVACDVGETGRLLRRYGFGVLTEANAAGFAGGIRALLESPADWSAMGEGTRKVAEEHFCWDTMCESLFDFLSGRLGLKL
jgi:glycosyltransferase involved in cell wall biosynthesis